MLNFLSRGHWRGRRKERTVLFWLNGVGYEEPDGVLPLAQVSTVTLQPQREVTFSQACEVLNRNPHPDGSLLATMPQRHSANACSPMQIPATPRVSTEQPLFRPPILVQAHAVDCWLALWRAAASCLPRHCRPALAWPNQQISLPSRVLNPPSPTGSEPSPRLSLLGFSSSGLGYHIKVLSILYLLFYHS